MITLLHVDVFSLWVTATHILNLCLGIAQVREPSLMRRKMLWMSGLRHRMCGRRPRVNIVDNATGQAKMGELVGVLGPSGSLLCPAVSC